jgi:hypothetical protein
MIPQCKVHGMVIALLLEATQKIDTDLAKQRIINSKKFGNGTRLIQ